MTGASASSTPSKKCGYIETQLPSEGLQKPLGKHCMSHKAEEATLPAREISPDHVNARLDEAFFCAADLSHNRWAHDQPDVAGQARDLKTRDSRLRREDKQHSVDVHTSVTKGSQPSMKAATCAQK